MPFDLLVFDLDGTLIDSELDLALAVNATRSNFGLGPLEHRVIASYVGEGAPLLIKRSLGPGAPDQQIEEGLQFFYAHYREHMLDNTYLYPGVRQGLDQLHESGAPMAVLTNKPVRFSQGIIEGLRLAGHFQRVYGGNSFETKKPHPEGLRFLMQELAAPKEGTLMVGDSAVDVQTARNAEVRCCGVTYGLRPDTLEEHPPDVLVDTFEEVVRFAWNGTGPSA